MIERCLYWCDLLSKRIHVVLHQEVGQALMECDTLHTRSVCTLPFTSASLCLLCLCTRFLTSTSCWLPSTFRGVVHQARTCASEQQFYNNFINDQKSTGQQQHMHTFYLPLYYILCNLYLESATLCSSSACNDFIDCTYVLVAHSLCSSTHRQLTLANWQHILCNQADWCRYKLFLYKSTMINKTQVLQ